MLKVHYTVSVNVLQNLTCESAVLMNKQLQIIVAGQFMKEVKISLVCMSYS